ncbi:MAG: DUF4956 domain-containing protein [Pseudobutyrivibrio sp.]|nr:DUF4956 domain-containing protein [Pseudobutyrivibrio sp.]
MSFTDLFKKSVVKSFDVGNIDPSTIVLCLLITFLLSLYIFMVYRLVSKSTFYDKEFNVSMAIVSMITAGIVLAMQSSLVVSLGMVGALSIVRFRTAVKKPRDLMFLFWSIGTGIICGAGIYPLAVILSLCVTIGIILLQLIPSGRSSLLLVINCDNKSAEAEIMAAVEEFTTFFKVDSKNVARGALDLVIEIRSDAADELVNVLSELQGVKRVALVSHEGEVKG